MGQKTGIEWTEATWNPIRGCSRVSEGCRNCYAETVAKRFSGPGQPYEGLIAKGGQWNGQIVEAPHKLHEPLRWTKPRMIFVNSMSDLFHERVPDSYIDQVFAVMALAQRHTFQILTKRPERMRDYLSSEGLAERIGWAEHEIFEAFGSLPAGAYQGPTHRRLPLENVWLGVSVEDQKTANERIPMLLNTPATIRWVSMEPLLGPVNLTRINGCPTDDRYMDSGCMDSLRCRRPSSLDWVVVGGESGAKARPMHPGWPRSLRDQCQAAGVPFLFKQWGEWTPSCGKTPRGQLDFRDGKIMANDGTLYDERDLAYPDGARRSEALQNGHESAQLYYVYRRGKKAAGRALDDRTWDEYPAGRSA